MTPKPKKAPPIGNQIKRDRAAAKWDKPLEGSRARAAAWLDMMLVDHGFIRSVYLNRHRLGPRAWRAAQPSPAQLKWFAKAGVKTVVSLRGGMMFGSLASVLHAHVIDGVPVEEARAQLSLKFGHFRQAKSGVLDAFFDTYLAERGTRELSLEEWIATEYDRMKIKAAFREYRTSGWFVDRVLGRE